MGRPSAREEIVQAGLKCLVEKGFNAVGVQDITDTAGVPKGSFYNHFESKEALGVEIVERYGANQTRREILTDPSVPPLQRLRRHFDRIQGEIDGKSEIQKRFERDSATRKTPGAARAAFPELVAVWQHIFAALAT